MQNKENWNTSWSADQKNNPPQNSDYEILELFPTPVYVTSMPPELSNVIPFLDAQTPNTGSDEANYGERSANSYILNEPECVEVKKFILEHIKEYAENILLYDYKTWELSQSWVSRKQPGQHHMMHTHPNSLLSGCFYYGEPEKETPAIKFHKMQGGINQQVIQPAEKADKRSSKFAWKEFSINFSPGLLLLFPSYLFHSVPINESKVVRSSLAFNVVPKNKLGSEENLTELRWGKII
jgi:uncharacterized protein (TIGR02466 family)